MLISATKTALRETKPVVESKSLHSHWCYTTKQAWQEQRAAVYWSHLSGGEESILFITASLSAHYLCPHQAREQNELVFELSVF